MVGLEIIAAMMRNANSYKILIARSVTSTLGITVIAIKRYLEYIQF